MARAKPVDVTVEPRLDVNSAENPSNLRAKRVSACKHMHVARPRIGVDGLQVQDGRTGRK